MAVENTALVSSLLASKSLLPFLIALGFLYLFFVIFSYVYTSIALMTIARKTQTPKAWKAWVPFANVHLMMQIAQAPRWTFYSSLFLLPGLYFRYLLPQSMRSDIVVSLVIIFISLLLTTIFIFWWWKIAERRGFYGWLSLLLFIPIVGFIVLGIIAWKD